MDKARPKIILKFAKSADGFIGSEEKQVWLSNQYSKRLTHKWRSEIDGIIVGKNTVLVDNPSLTTRFDFGKSPVRIILGKKSEFSGKYNIKNGKAVTIFWQKHNVVEMLLSLKNQEIRTVMVEGGARILSIFLEQKLWDEARVFTAQKKLFEGVKAPKIKIMPIKTFKILNDKLEIFRPNHHSS